jgi:hypothetical protein
MYEEHERGRTMSDIVKAEYDKVIKKRDEVKELLHQLESEEPKDTYNIRINRDRLAYWEGRAEGLKFALDHLSDQHG